MYSTIIQSSEIQIETYVMYWEGQTYELTDRDTDRHTGDRERERGRQTESEAYKAYRGKQWGLYRRRANIHLVGRRRLSPPRCLDRSHFYTKINTEGGGGGGYTVNIVMMYFPGHVGDISLKRLLGKFQIQSLKPIKANWKLFAIDHVIWEL